MRLLDVVPALITLALVSPGVCAQMALPAEEDLTPSGFSIASETSPESIVEEWEAWLRITPEEDVREAFATKSDELLARVEMGSLTPSSAARLAPLLMISKDHLQGVADTMGSFADKETAQGATARTIQLWFNAENTSKPVAPLELSELLDHPGLDEAVRTGVGYALFEMLAKQLSVAGGEFTARRAGRVSELLTHADVSLDTVGLIATAKLYITVLEPAGLEMMSDSRVHLLGVYEQAALGLNENEGMQRVVMKQIIDAVGFIGGPAGVMDFSWTSDGFDAVSLEQLEGRVVVIDFWATWCGPCIRAFPKIRELQEHYKDSAVTIIGVTSLQGAHYGAGAKTDTEGKPKLEYRLMAGLIKDLDVTWPIAFSDEKMYGVDYRVMSIPHLAIVAPDGTLRANGLHPMMPDAEKHAIIDGLLEEFGLEVPGE